MRDRPQILYMFLSFIKYEVVLEIIHLGVKLETKQKKEKEKVAYKILKRCICALLYGKFCGGPQCQN